MPRVENNLPDSYPALLEDIKSRIRAAQIKAALSVNRELINYTGILASLFLHARTKRGGENRWLSAYLLIFEMRFLR